MGNGAIREDLRPFLHPQGIAVIGATEDPHKLGYGVMSNLLHPDWGFPGPVYPVNPKRSTILGRRAYPDVREVPDPVDLALVLIPAPHVPAAVAACGERGIRGVIVISGGFRELGQEGERLQKEMVALAHRFNMRLMGPNGIGVIDTLRPLNTTFIRAMPLRGAVGVISQSGALCGALVDWTRPRGMGFSRMYSIGNQADLTESDFLELMATDPATRVICLYVEEIRDGRRFYDIASRVTREKPVLLLKAGRTQAGREAARSHTGALAGSVEAYKAACWEAGVHWCTSVQEMIEAAHALTMTPTPAGPRVAIITNAGGPAALATDALAEAGLEVASLHPTTQNALRQVLPPAAQVHPVVDMLGAAGPQEYQQAAAIVFHDPNVDAVLAIHVPQATVRPETIVHALREALTRSPNKPLILALPGMESTLSSLREAHHHHLPTVTFPEHAARVLHHLLHHARVRATTTEPPRRPSALPSSPLPFPQGPVLTDWDLRPILAAYHIPLPPAGLARTPEEAPHVASHVGYPVALKLLSPDALHKSDIGGVVLNLNDPHAVYQAAQHLWDRFHRHYPEGQWQGVEVQRMVPGRVEVILGVVRDPQFGPLVMCGTGGVWVEVVRDVAFALAPLTPERARQLLRRTRVPALWRARRATSDRIEDKLVEILVHLSWLAVDWPELQELDINPLIISPDDQTLYAVDTRATTA